MSSLQRKWGISTGLLIVLVLVAASFLVYADTLQGDFVWDDRALFVEHYSLWQWGNIKQLLTSQDNLFGDRYTGYYRPFSNIIFLLERYLWEKNPAGYHFTNTVFHVLTTLSVYWLALILFKAPCSPAKGEPKISDHALARCPAGNALTGALQPRALAFWGALCFALHPVHTEDVAWINGLNNVVSSLFYILSFILYLKYAKKERSAKTYYGLSLLAFLLSLLSKEYALTFPLIIACHEYTVQHTSLREKSLRLARRILPYMIIILAYLVVRSMVLPAHGIKFMHWETFWMRVFTIPKTFAIYFRLLVLPVDLTVHYETTLITSVMDPVLWITTGIALCTGCLLYYTYHCSRASFLMLSWIILTLTPVLNLVPLSDEATFIAERYLYLPSVGFCIITGQLLARYWHLWRSRKEKPVFAFPFLFGCLLLQWYAFGTLNRNLSWRNGLNLWTDEAARTPESFRPYFNLAVAYRDQGRHGAAIEMFDKAYWMASGPKGKGLILSNVAKVYYLNKDYDRANARLKEALSLSPANPGIYNLLGNVYFMEHKFEMALEQYKKALEFDPGSKDPLINIGMSYFRMGKMDEAINHLEKVKSTIPDNGRLYYYLGSAYDNKGMDHEAARYYAIYLKLLPLDKNRQEVAKRLKKMGATPLISELLP
jgi:tetratricopeptide (TPR) repeat protein